ncbi:MAG: hypothetical protein IIA17_02070 [candidate division Zixibacteria bacterium]|nr:hypothetical protein [candidate division Zixibacteria bacterium]
MNNRIIGYVLLISFSASLTFTQSQTDILEKVLGEVGFTKDDLGYQPKGYWNRFPLDIPYKLTSFDDLFAEPLKLYDYARVMSNAVELYLEPAYADSADDGLYKLVYNLGVDKRQGGFRSYSANLIPAPDVENPIAESVQGLYEQAGLKREHYTFGQKAGYPGLDSIISEQTSILPDTVRAIIAELIVNLGEAIHWRNLAIRNCESDDLQKVFAIRNLAETQSDGTVYYPEIDDVANSIDWQSLYYAALKTVAASEQAERKLLKWTDKVATEFEIEIATPYGKIAILSPNYIRKQMPPAKFLSGIRASRPAYFEMDATDFLVIIDFGRRSIYQGSAGATSSLDNPISVIIDMGGNDYYGYQRKHYPPTTAVGILGIGVVIDTKGDDHYNGSTFAQGAGFFGVGVLLDREGDDKYKAEVSSQGCGYFGIGLCLDGTGHDKYYLYGDGQGMGGVGGGVGVLASFGGNDKYTAEPYAKVFDRGDYHSKFVINGNQAQGVGFGRRGDGSDGHSWAGGLGAIIDINGDDHYYSGNFTLGVGYWFGTGIAIDRNGNDVYESCYFTQGSGAHFCNGILIDEGGDDRHELFETAGAGLGFGWDYTNAFLINKGGNDIYRAKIISMGLAQIRSNAFLIDIGGDDSYYLGENTAGLGEATYRDNFKRPSNLTPYFSYAKSFGGFIDIGGSDNYYSFKDKKESAHPTAKNNFMWLKPERTDSTFGADNFGVGIDIDSGTIPGFFKWED